MDAFSQFPFEDILRYGVALVIIGAGIISILYSIWGGLLLITSGGKEEKVKPAVNHIRHAIIGVIVLMLVLFVSPMIARILGFEYADSIRPTSVFAAIQELTGKIFGGWSGFSDPSLNTPSSNSVGTDFTDL